MGIPPTTLPLRKMYPCSSETTDIVGLIWKERLKEQYARNAQRLAWWRARMREIG